MTKIVRDLSTEENRLFWEAADRAAQEVETWPAWKRAGINVPPAHSEQGEHKDPCEPSSEVVENS